MWYVAMIYMLVRRTSIFLADEDRAAIRVIQERFGVSTDSDAIRLALRVLSQAKEIALSPLPSEKENGPIADDSIADTAQEPDGSEKIHPERHRE